MGNHATVSQGSLGRSASRHVSDSDMELIVLIAIADHSKL